MKTITTILLLCSAVSGVNAQVYNFSITPNDGCNPLTVTVTNLTTDTNAYYYEWTFISSGGDSTIFTGTMVTTFTQTIFINPYNNQDTGGMFVVCMIVYDNSFVYLGSMCSASVHLISSTVSIYSTPDTCFAGAGEATATGCCGYAPYTYLWSNNSTTQTIAGLLGGTTYTVTTTNSYGCSAVDSLVIGTAAYPTPSICIVSIDTSVNENIIVWEEQSYSQSIIYNIYKETTTAGVYDLIGNVPSSALSTFADTSSQPAQIAARYKISITDTCGNESTLSIPHKTIHLTIGLGIPPAINLNWDNYQGISFSQYNILRGNSGGNLTFMTSIQSTLNSYTDLNPPAGTNFYAIEAVYSQGCNPSLKSAGVYNSSLSNIVNNYAVGINEQPESVNILLSPNPVNGIISLKSNRIITSIEIINIPGEQIFALSPFNKQCEIDITSCPIGIYLVKVKSGDTTFIRKFLKFY